MKKKIIGIAALSILPLAALATPAHADPIACPPGQVATLNPADGGWICVNAGGNTNLSEDPVGDKPKGYFAH